MGYCHAPCMLKKTKFFVPTKSPYFSSGGQHSLDNFSFLHSGYILLGTVSNLKVARVLIVELVLDLTIIHVAEILLAGC